MTSSSTPATIVFLHAHPDDECILTGATMAKAAALGHRSIAVYGTRGDAGETNADLAGESLGERRRREALAACASLGVARVEWLPFADSGMAGTDTTSNPDAFSNASVIDVAQRVVELLADESIDVVVGYDENGTYGHPDHVQVHRVARAAAPLLGADWVLDATYCREHLAALPDSDGSLDLSFASAEADLTHFVTGEQWLLEKVRAVAHHGSQIPDDWDTDRPDIDGFRARFGTEWFIATAIGDGADLLAEVFEAKANWTPTR